MRFLADESCGFAAVTALRQAGHDVVTVVDTVPGAEDDVVLALARSEARVLLTEDKDFGLLAYAGGHTTNGVVLIRFPANARGALGATVVETVATFGERMHRAFVVVAPGRARFSRPPGVAD